VGGSSRSRRVRGGHGAYGGTVDPLRETTEDRLAFARMLACGERRYGLLHDEPRRP